MNILNQFTAFTKNAAIGTRLAVLAAAPIVGLTIASFLVVSGERAKQIDLSGLNELSNFVLSVGALVHETQKERGMSAGYLSSGGTQMKIELPSQRQLTDQRLAVVQDQMLQINWERYDPALASALTAGLDQLKNLDVSPSNS